MPLKDKHAYNAYRRDLYRKRKRAVAAYRAARKTQRIALDRDYREFHRAEIRARFNERHFRFQMYSVARISPETRELLEHCQVVNRLELENPIFIFIHEGKRCVEHLYSPLPSW